MAVTQLQLCVLPHRFPRLNPSSSSSSPSPKRKYMPCQFWCIKSSSLHGRSFKSPNRGNCKVMSQKIGNKLDSTMYINVEDDSDIELLRIEQVKSSQIHLAKVLMGLTCLYVPLRLAKLNVLDIFIKIAGKRWTTLKSGTPMWSRDAWPLFIGRDNIGGTTMEFLG